MWIWIIVSSWVTLQVGYVAGVLDSRQIPAQELIKK